MGAHRLVEVPVLWVDLTRRRARRGHQRSLPIEPDGSAFVNRKSLVLISNDPRLDARADSWD
jgi:hypothetical protein